MASFFESLDSESILREVGIHINLGKLPMSCTCPMCKRSTLFVVNTEDGIWGACETCGLAGDPLKIYALCTNSDINKAVAIAVSRNWIRPPSGNEVLLYTLHNDSYCNLHLEFKRWREKARAHDLYVNNQGARAQLQAFNLDPLEPSYGTRGGRLFAPVTLYDIRDAYSRVTDRQAGVMGKAGVCCMVTPLMQAPARVSCFVCLQVVGGTTVNVYYTCGDSDGLAFLEAQHLYADRVYLTSDIGSAALWQARHACASSSSLPLLGITADTHQAYRSLAAGTLIYIASGEDLADALYSLRHQAHRARILELASGEFKNWRWNSAEVAGTLDRFAQSSRQYYEVLSDYLLSITAARAKNLLERLDLDKRQLALLLGHTSAPQHRITLEGLTKTQVEEKYIQLTNGRAAYVRDDRIFFETCNEARPALAGGAVPYLDTVSSHSGKTFYVGRMRVNGKTLPFRVDAKNFTAQWAENFLDQAGQPASFAASLRADFRHICLQISTPEQSNALSTIGWHGPQASVVFPRISIGSDGKIVPTGAHNLFDHPAASLVAAELNADDFRVWYENVKVSAPYITALSAVCSCIMAPADGQARRYVLWADDAVEARSVASLVSRDCGLYCFSLVKSKSTSTSEPVGPMRSATELDIELQAGTCGVPVVVRCNDPVELRRWMARTESYNVIVVADRLTALCAPHDWCALNVSSVGRFCGFGGSATFLSMLSFALEDRSTHGVSGFSAITTWPQRLRRYVRAKFGIEGSYADMSAAVVTATVRATTTPEASYVRKYIDTIVEGHYVPAEVVPLAELPDGYSSDCAVVHGNNWMAVSSAQVNKELRRTGLVFPSHEELIDIFTSASDDVKEHHGRSSVMLVVRSGIAKSTGVRG